MKSFRFEKKGISLQSKTGVLAHLARARHWQCRGERFESAILHRNESRLIIPVRFFVLMGINRLNCKKVG